MCFKENDYVVICQQHSDYSQTVSHPTRMNTIYENSNDL